MNLGDEGLSPGDTIDPYLDEYFTDGTVAVVPAGEYEWNGDGIGGNFADAGLVGDGEVVLRHEDGMHRAPTTHATGGTVRFADITIRGECDGDDSRWRLQADEDADLVLENVALPDGMEGQFGDATGIYVPPSHAGTLTLRNVHLEDFSNNGLYASAPGKPSQDGQQGAVYVEGGLYRNNNVAGVRLGSNGSHAIGVTIVNDALSTDIGDEGTAQRGLRIREPGDDILVEDCDIYHSFSDSASPIQLHPGAEGGTGTIRNTRVYTETGASAVSYGSGVPDGWTVESLSITGDGDTSYPDGWSNVCVGGSCPVADPEPSDSETTSGGSDDGSTGSENDGGSAEGSGDLFVVEAADGGPKFSYEFAGTGTVTPVLDGSTLEADGNDDITTKEDGTYAVAGVTGNGYGDSFRVDGDIDSFTSTTAAENYTLLLAGDETTAGELVATDAGDEPTTSRLAVEAVENGPRFEYEFVASGPVAPVEDAGTLKAEGNDTIVENDDGTYTVTGVTGNGYGDSFDVTGAVTAFSATVAESNFVLRVDDEPVSVAELVDGGDPEPLPNSIVFDGAGSAETTAYEFEVTGSVSAGDSVEAGDAIEGTTVSGAVTEGVDAYRFSGDVASFSLDGPATVAIEDTD
ncbi:hypothetical protein [Halosegnis marinus]|uniref:Right handed beta helix region n=1 Tax=Halosegnis marinus TaxID=3034023 RepID=A0ABD5ZRA6_9EURY|nr:hypothetical protein [Halosegnis sp. DT85]